MKRLSTVAFLLFTLVLTALASQPKYVFYMIGDGMGLNQVISTERYLAALDGKIGRDSLCMTTFPVFGLANTYSNSNGVTDSSAAGTALAAGVKTTNGKLGVDSDNNPVTSIAAMAKRSGKAVGVTTSVSIDHATPGAFYAHNPSRSDYYNIGIDLANSGFDFFGGADFLRPVGKDRDQKSLHKIAAEKGYYTVRGAENMANLPKGTDKVILTQKLAEGKTEDDFGPNRLPYAIDRKEGDMTLAQIVEAATDFLYSTGKDFFLMVEGGAIDWACHSNDAATAIQEVLDFDQAINVAYNFYLQHPDETLIVVTADHETGGMALGNSDYVLRFEKLANQTLSQETLSKEMFRFIRENDPSWEEIKSFLAANVGLWNEVEVSEQEEADLLKVYEDMMQHRDKIIKNEYTSDSPVVVAAVKLLNRKSKVGWTTGGHSGACVGVFAIGAGSENFGGSYDNTDIPKRIATLGGYQ